MGSYCSTARHTRVVWPIVLKAENNGPFSEDTLERSPEIDEDGKPNYGGRKRSSADWESKTPVRSYGKIENSSMTNGKAGCKAIDLDMIKEDGNNSKCQSGECSPVAKTFEFKRGPMIDGSNPAAEVYECLDLNQGDRLAVKTFKTSKEEDFEKFKAYCDEIRETLGKLQDTEHENLLKYYGMDLTEENGPPKCLTIDVVMEFASGGSVYDLVVKFSALDERLIRKYTQQILEGLTHLHSQGIIHGNLKSSNVLIDSNGIIKLSDVDGIVGVKSILEEKSQFQPQIPNVSSDSVYWTAPEVFVTNTIDIYTDLWSVGCIVLEMLTGTPPWGMNTADDAYKKLIAGKPIELPADDVSDNCRDFLEKIFQHNPKNRPSSYDMLDHCFISDKNHDNSSVMETLQTLQSFSLPNRQGGMFQSGSLTSMNLQNDLSSNEIAPRNSMNVSGRKSPEKDQHRRESKDQTRRESAMTAMRQSVLSRVFETNTEEETSPIERRDRFGNKIVQKGRYFNKAPTIEEKNLPPNLNNNNNPKKTNNKLAPIPIPAQANMKLKKSRTADLMPVKEAIDQEDHAEAKFKTEVDDSKTIQDEKEVKIPFTPIRSSVFKALKSCDPNNFDLDGEVSQEEVLTPKWETGGEKKTEAEIKEEQRRKFEEELMRQLEQVQSKTNLSQEEFGQSYDGNTKIGSLHSREVTQQDITEVLDPEEQRRRIEADIMNQLARIKSKDLGGTGIESVPFSESGRSTIILSRPKTKEFGGTMTIGMESIPFTDSKNNSTVMKLESYNSREFEIEERKRRIEQRSGQVEKTPNRDGLLGDFLQAPDESRSVIKLESFNSIFKSNENLTLTLRTRGRGVDPADLNKTKEMSLPFSESKIQQETSIQNLKEPGSPQLTTQEKRRLFEEDILKQLQRINTEDLSFSGDASGNHLSRNPSKKENITLDHSPIEGANFGDLNDSPNFKNFKKQLDDLEK